MWCRCRRRSRGLCCPRRCLSLLLAGSLVSRSSHVGGPVGVARFCCSAWCSLQVVGLSLTRASLSCRRCVIVACVAADVRGLLADDSLLNDTAESTFSQWNTDQMLQVVSPNGGHQVRVHPSRPSLPDRRPYRGSCCCGSERERERERRLARSGRLLLRAIEECTRS